MVRVPVPALAVAVLGFFVITLDALIVAIALPLISDDLGGGVAGLQWVVDAYTLVFAGLLLISGTLSDRFGARRVFAWGAVVFTGASAACAAAPGLSTLVAARSIQGVGAALMTPASLSLIREAFPEARARARAIGLWAASGAVASAAGPIAGGLLTLVDWRLIFLVNVPLGLGMMLALRHTVPSPATARPIDWPGLLLGLFALVTLVWAIIQGGVAGFGTQALTALGAAGVAAVGFVVLQHRVAHPSVPAHLLSSPTVRTALFSGFCFMASFFGMVFVMTLFLQEQRGLTPLQAGMTFLPMTALSAVTNVASGRMSARYGPRLPLSLGLAVIALGLIGLALVLAHGPLPVLVALMAAVGAGGALASPPVTSLVLDHADPQWAGTASALLNTSRQVGAALSVACFGALISGLGLRSGAQVSLTAASLLIVGALVTVHLVGSSVVRTSNRR